MGFYSLLGGLCLFLSGMFGTLFIVEGLLIPSVLMIIGMLISAGMFGWCCGGNL